MHSYSVHSTTAQADQTVQPILECIPNFSEGRRPEVIEALVQAVADVPGVALLHRTSDVDHNRTVLTFAGQPEAVVEAAFASIARASELINMDQHSGQHPRLGAADVVPLVPIRNMTLADCVPLAHQLGERVAGELGLPVYFYEAAALRPERKLLANVRRGGYEALRQNITTDSRQPDCGPSQVGSAGAVIIGARDVLIAFNVFLDTADVRIAQKIARSIRESNGGLPHVRALGLFVGGQAQVSMNLTDYRITPLAQVLDAVRERAAEMQVRIARCELIGLAPRQVIYDAAAWYLQLDDFNASRVLDDRIEALFPGGGKSS